VNLRNDKGTSVKGIIKALGLVFGDIGTSPIYTITVVFLLLSSTRSNILGVVSLVIWTLIILVTIQFAWLAMNLSIRGEGGKIVLKEILLPLLKSKKSAALVSLLAIIGISLLIGDGVITPAISIMSAVEGSLFIPGLESLSKTTIVLISMFIAILLFLFQKKGTERVAGAFGPIMSIWFLFLAFSGIIAISEAPEIMDAFNPWLAVRFFLEHGFTGFIVLGEVILCATGGEALYADMGHLGAKPIRQAWVGVFMALVVNYLGQGAFLLRHPEAQNVIMSRSSF
jgi:KUP system potassium uptake protein